MAIIRFGVFELDRGRRLLLREGAGVHLSPKAFRLLEVLLERRPDAISKQQLHDELWPGTFVSESNLAGLITELRGALGDDARSPAFIRTVHAFGYSFCGNDVKAGPEPRESISALVEWNGRQTALADGENVIGRDASVAVFIDDSTVSRHHARLMVASDRATLEDLGSKNGTFIGGQRIESVDLEDGSEFHVGGVKVIFRRPQVDGSTMTLVVSREG